MVCEGLQLRFKVPLGAQRGWTQPFQMLLGISKKHRSVLKEHSI